MLACTLDNEPALTHAEFIYLTSAAAEMTNIVLPGSGSAYDGKLFDMKEAEELTLTMEKNKQTMDHNKQRPGEKLESSS